MMQRSSLSHNYIHVYYGQKIGEEFVMNPFVTRYVTSAASQLFDSTESGTENGATKLETGKLELHCRDVCQERTCKLIYHHGRQSLNIEEKQHAW